MAGGVVLSGVTVVLPARPTHLLDVRGARAPVCFRSVGRSGFHGRRNACCCMSMYGLTAPLVVTTFLPRRRRRRPDDGRFGRRFPWMSSLVNIIDILSAAVQRNVVVLAVLKEETVILDSVITSINDGGGCPDFPPTLAFLLTP